MVGPVDILFYCKEAPGRSWFKLPIPFSAYMSYAPFPSKGARVMKVYAIEGSDLCLTGTAEVPLGAVYMDQIIPEESLPLKMAAFGHCFRTEAGAAGELSLLSLSHARCTSVQYDARGKL